MNNSSRSSNSNSNNNNDNDNKSSVSNSNNSCIIHNDNNDNVNANKKPRFVYDTPTTLPTLSLHYQNLIIQRREGEKDVEKGKGNDNHNDRCNNTDADEIIMIQNLDELKTLFYRDMSSPTRNIRSANRHNDYHNLALWSIICGYCEALATNKDPNLRYRIFPIPIKALKRLIHDEFIPYLYEQLNNTKYENKNKNNNNDDDDDDKNKNDEDNDNNDNNNKKQSSSKEQIRDNNNNNNNNHRDAVRIISNAVWKKAYNKKHSIKDELHANSLYTCLRGYIDKKSLDCFGAAIVTIIGLNLCSYRNSLLTLSEDHAYESHLKNSSSSNNNDHQQPQKNQKQKQKQQQQQQQQRQQQTKKIVEGKKRKADNDF